MNLIDLEPYINGQKFTRPAHAPYRGDTELFDKISKLVQCGNTAKQNLAIYEIPKEFYEVEPDFKHFIPKEAQEEMFFALKNGYIVPSVPAKSIYYVRKAYNLYKIPNLIFKLIPEKEYNIFFQENYFDDGLTMRDVICNFCYDQYSPISSSKLMTTVGDYREVYVQETDMVSIMPKKIAENFSHEDILSLKVDDHGIKLGESYVKFMNGYNGGCESIYDLRTLI